MIGLAFEGCACRAAFSAGAVAAFIEARLNIRLTAGTSSGSICAVAVAAGLGSELPALWRGNAGRSIISFQRLRWNRSVFDMSYLVRTNVASALGDLDLRTAPVEALVVATAARGLSRRVYSSRTEPSMIDPVLGSCFLPVLYGRPVRVRGELLLDGGLTDNLPIELLAEHGAEEIIAVLPSPDGLSFKSPRRRQWRPTIAGRRVHVVHPRRPLALRSWDLDRDRVERALEEGWHRGRELCGS